MRFNLVVSLCQLVLSSMKTTWKLVEKSLFQDSQCLVRTFLPRINDLQVVQDRISRFRAFHNNDVRKQRDRFYTNIAEENSNFSSRWIFEHSAKAPLRHSFVSNTIVLFHLKSPFVSLPG